MKRFNKHINGDLLLVMFILIFEYSIFFYGAHRKMFWAFIILLLIILNLGRQNRLINKKIFFIIVIVYLLILVQGVMYEGFSIAAIYKPIWLFLTPFLVISYLGQKFLKNLFKGIYLLSITSTIIYLLYVFIPLAGKFIDNLFQIVAPYSGNQEPTSLIIFSIPQYYQDFNWPRNSGFAHEPGAFALIILFGIVLNLLRTRTVFNKSNFVLACILLTTFSTMGYIALFVYFGYYLIRSRAHILFKILLLPVFLMLFYYVYSETQFMQSKLESSLNDDLNAYMSEERMQRGRFFAFIKAAEAIPQSPITGRGILTATKSDIVDEKASFGYGFMGLLVKFGLFFGVFYLYFFYKGFEKVYRNAGLLKSDALMAFFIINLAFLSQPFFFTIPVVIFFIIGYNYKLPLPVSLSEKIFFRAI